MMQRECKNGSDLDFLVVDGVASFGGDKLSISHLDLEPSQKFGCHHLGKLRELHVACNSYIQSPQSGQSDR